MARQQAQAEANSSDNGNSVGYTSADRNADRESQGDHEGGAARGGLMALAAGGKGTSLRGVMGALHGTERLMTYADGGGVFDNGFSGGYSPIGGGFGNNVQQSGTPAIPYGANQNAMLPQQQGGDSFGGFQPGFGMQQMAMGGVASGHYNLGSYSDGGRLLRGPGDGVSDSIPATIGHNQPARLADGEFVFPARIVSEIGNGSTEAGARKLYQMMARIQAARGKTVGKDKVATDTKAEKYLSH